MRPKLIGGCLAAGLLVTLAAQVQGQEAAEFHQGLYSLDLSGSYVKGYHDPQDRMGAATVAVGYYLADNLWLGVGASGYFIGQPDGPLRQAQGGPDAGAAGADLMFRYHLLTLDRFSVYVDGGAGGFFADYEIPNGGTHFNFTEKGGLGASFRLVDHAYLMGGARYFHLSNATIQGDNRNPGFDGIQFYAGMIFTF